MAARKRRLNATVYVMQDGNVVGYGPESDDIPPEVAKQIGDHAWSDGDASEDEQPQSDPGTSTPAQRRAAAKQ